MIDERLEIGTKIYFVDEDSNAFSRKKIFKTDENGVEWFRYDQPRRTHNMIENTIVGRVLKNVEGDVSGIEDHIDEYYLDDGNVIDEGNINEFDNWSGYFLNKEDALAWIETRKAEADRAEHS